MGIVWIVEDELNLLRTTQMMLSRAGHEVTGFSSGKEAILAMARMGKSGAGLDADVVLTDFMLGDATGVEVLKAAKAIDASTQVVLMTAFANTQTAVEAMKEGAFDYIEKPFKRDALLELIASAAHKRETMREKRLLQTRNNAQAVLSNFIATAPAMKSIIDLIVRVAPTKANILVTGESGTGKEVIARAVHQLSSVSAGPFIPVNCGAIPESLLESEFFGYVKGAFTGATRDKIGFFGAASGGTLFLDEIGELPLPMQVKLLRAIQEKKIQRVGSTTEIPVDVRIIAATNRNLREAVSQKQFREDLFFRLNVIQIALPPLRERIEDIPALVHFFIQKYNHEYSLNVRDASPEVLHCLRQYPFDGNVRELENIIEHAMTLEMSDQITMDSLPLHVTSSFRHVSAPDRLLAMCGAPQEDPVEAGAPQDDSAESGEFETLRQQVANGEGVKLENIVEDFERVLIKQSLQRTHGNLTKAAELLGISFRSMRYRLKKYGVNTDKDTL